jgi:TolB protein
MRKLALLFLLLPLSVLSCDGTPTDPTTPAPVDAPTAPAFQIAPNPQLINGGFEEGDLSLGWRRVGTQNYSITRTSTAGNHFATLEVGEGPTGDASCTQPVFNNFAALGQTFTLRKNSVIELDFHVPLPAASDATEDANCFGYDRIAINLSIRDEETFQIINHGFVLVDFFGGSGLMRGHLQVNDNVLGTVASTSFNPAAFARTTLGPLVLEESSALPGWLHVSMDVGTDFFPWLPDEVMFNISIRNTDARFTGKHFSVSIDNVAALGGSLQVPIDIKPGSDPSCFNNDGNGVIPVAVLGTADFDVTQVDLSTVQLEGMPVQSAGGSGKLQANIEDVNSDGFDDLVVQIGDVVGTFTGSETTATLTGSLRDGTAIEGSDAICLLAVGCESSAVAGRIAFFSFRDGNLETYVMDARGTKQTNLTNHPAADLFPSLSSDGTRITFTRHDGNAEIYVMDADGSNPVRLTNHPSYDAQPSWSPDGTRITFYSGRDSNGEIYVMNADGSDPVNLTNHPANDGSPAWSPDGMRVAFTSYRDGNAEIYVMDADGSNSINLTNHPADDQVPAWSPDGSQVAFTSDRDGNFEIYAMNADGSKPVNLTSHPGIDFWPSWGGVSRCGRSVP